MLGDLRRKGVLRALRKGLLVLRALRKGLLVTKVESKAYSQGGGGKVQNRR